jgi:spore coat polysaccharide biosynthesis predicted glycosyltransferase SpsG
MLLFGGTDPSGLGERIAILVSADFPDIRVDWIEPGQDRPIAEAMHNADLLITSAGRTVYEAAAVGVPTVVLAQNLRETTHQHLGMEHGNVYLGLGKLVTDDQIVDTIDILSKDMGLRTELSERGRPDGRGLDRIVHTIEGLLGGL